MKFESTSWFARLLGIDPDRVSDGSVAELRWTNLPQSWEVFVLIGVAVALVYFVGFLYWREIDTCPRGAKVVLAVLRSAVLLVLLAVLLGPSVTYTQERTLRAKIIILRDASASMAIRDSYLDGNAAKGASSVMDVALDKLRQSPPERAEIVDVMLSKDSGSFVKKLRNIGNVTVLDFPSNGALQEKAQNSKNEKTPTMGFPPLAGNAKGPATDLTAAIRLALKEKHLAAVVLLTDGQHTEGGDPAEAAEEARQRGVKLLVVGIGDPTVQRNLEVKDVFADDEVWKGTDFEILGLLRSEGYVGRTVNVTLSEQEVSDDGKATKSTDIRTETVKIEKDGQISVPFKHKVATAGRRRYSIRVEKLKDEFNPDDNTALKPKDVTILDNHARVLLISGGPSWEYRGVMRVLRDDESVNLSCWMQTIAPNRAQDGNTIITTLPQSEEELLAYDVILLFDPDPRDFDKKFVDLLHRFVDKHARGLMYMAGTKFSGRFLGTPPTSRLDDLLPVTFRDVRTAGLLQLSNRKEYPIGIDVAAADHPILRFSPDVDETLRLWRSLPGFYWSFPAQDLKPGARMLLEHGNPELQQIDGKRPLLVTRRYGAGRTLYLGFNGTWRWKAIGVNQEFFNRFWLQTVRYLTEGRLLSGKRRGYVSTDRSRYERNANVTIKAVLNDSQSKPITVKSFPAQLLVPGQKPIELDLEATAGKPGEYRKTIQALALGPHQVTIKLEDDLSSGPTMTTEFTVEPPLAETRQRHLDRTRLQQIVENNPYAQYYDMGEFMDLVKNITPRNRTIRVEGETMPLWDTALLLGILVVLLAAEWSIRKYYKLV